MIRRFALLLLVVLWPGVATAQPVGDHTYFETHLDHPNLIESYSLRDQAELDAVSNRQGDSGTVTYDPATDTYHDPQDAAKVVIASGKGSLRPFPMLPIGVSQGSVLTVWDHWWGREYLDPGATDGKYNHKQFVYLHGNDNNRWTELRAHYLRNNPPPGSVAQLDMRSYGQLIDLNPDGTRKYQMTSNGVIPREGNVDFFAKPETWTRYFWLAEDVGTITPKISLWIADEGRDPVLLYKRVTVARTIPIHIDYLRCQFNASRGREPGSPKLVSYLRDALVFSGLTFEDVVADPSLLVRPTGDGSGPGPDPEPEPEPVPDPEPEPDPEA